MMLTPVASDAPIRIPRPTLCHPRRLDWPRTQADDDKAAAPLAATSAALEGSWKSQVSTNLRTEVGSDTGDRTHVPGRSRQYSREWLACERHELAGPHRGGVAT